MSLAGLIERYKADPESVYHTWFVHEARLKAFRAIRQGVLQVIADIKSGAFPPDFKGSSLETVLAGIGEQKQVFQGANHAFIWKPKLRIPDIYEHRGNQLAFGQCLEACAKTQAEEGLLRAVSELAARRIKGLGPAVANILYFLHPTVFVPFNTAIVRGYNAVFGERLRLGQWDDYFRLREGTMAANDEHRRLLSKDLGAIAGLLYEVGSGRYAPPAAPTAIAGERGSATAPVVGGSRGTGSSSGRTPLAGGAARTAPDEARHREVEADRQHERQHAEIQHRLITLGRALGYDVWVAGNDRGREWNGERFSMLCLDELPYLGLGDEVTQTIRLIDVLWFRKGSGVVEAAFEIEHSTSIYSGILRMVDLARSLPNIAFPFYLVVPDERETQVLQQLRRPAFADLRNLRVKYLLYRPLCEHCDAIARFGSDVRAIDRLAAQA